MSQAKGYNVTFWQIMVMYQVQVGVAQPSDMPFWQAMQKVHDANPSGFGWLVEQAKLCQNAKLETEEAVNVINGRIANETEA